MPCPARLARLSALALSVACSVALLACEGPKPTRLSMDPSGPFRFLDKGESKTVQVAGYLDEKKPYTNKLEVTWSSSDEAVATVDQKGKIVAAGTGKATITAEAMGIKQTCDVDVQLIGGVALDGTPPKKLKLGKTHQLKAIVKDDKGAVMEKVIKKKVWETSNYCVTVTPDGLVEAVSLGKCKVTVKVGGFEAGHEFEVHE
jgi:hypothetical protein